MTVNELKRLCDDVQLACAEGYPPGCDDAARRVCPNGHFREGLTVRLARAASILLDQLEWHAEGADAHQRLSELVSELVLHAEHQAQKLTHRVSADRIRFMLEKL